MRLKIIETILALLIPFLTGYITTNENSLCLKITIGLIGIVVAAVANLITLIKLQENWIVYRTTAESLKHEKFLYLTKAGPYAGTDSFPLFVERIESYISKENTQWATYIKKDDNSSTEEAAGK
jgi:hypothetical protein